MNRLLLLTLIIIAAVSHSAGQPKAQRRVDGVRGPVHTVRIERAGISSVGREYIEGARVLNAIHNYNDDWTRVELVFYDPNGSVHHKSVYTYDADGKLIEMDEYQGNETLQAKSILIYDDKQRPIEQVFYKADGSVASRIAITQHDSGRVSEGVSYDGDGLFLGRDISVTDPKAKKGESFHYGADGMLATQTSVVTSAEGSAERKEEKTDTPPAREVITPDGKGYLAESAEYAIDGSLLRKERYTREYDTYGNWTKETRMEWVTTNGNSYFRPVEVTYRIITYY
jgi:YD repeat-containing protein